MKKVICFSVLVICLIGQANATSNNMVVTWNFNGNTNDNFGNPSINSNILFNNGSVVLNNQSLIRVPNKPEYLFDTGITIAGRVKLNQMKQGYIIFKGSNNAANGVFLLQITDFDRFQAGIFETVDGRIKWKPLVVSAEDVIPNVWYDVVFTYDNRVAKLYVNNKRVSVTNYQGHILQDTSDVTIGNRGDLNRGFLGLFDKVEMINRALTDDEVAKRYTLQSSEVNGNSVCEGYENKDNSPEDCGIQVDYRNLGDLYHSKNESIRLWKELVQNHPGISSYEVIGKSVQGRDIYLFKFGNPNGGKFMFDGQVHGIEDCGTETGYKFVKWVLESNESEAIRIRNNNYLLAIPIINMDATKRQNMRTVNSEGTLVPYGVDLNRNFAAGWGASWSGTSNYLNNYDYRGQGAASEPETQAVSYAISKYKPAVYLNVHCGARFLSYTSNTPLTSKILQRIGEISNRTGASTISLYLPSLAGGAGMVMGEAAAQGASSWIFEITNWKRLPITLEEYHNNWYKQAFPVYAGMSNAVEK